LLLDFGYSVIQFRDRSITNSSLMYGPTPGGFNGLYSSHTASIAINLTYSWN
jgi:hypothetical protein